MAYVTSWYWDKGNFRENNEDSFSLQMVRLKKGGLFREEDKKRRDAQAALLLVCDGIGGLPEGETASGFVSERLTEWFYREGIGRMRAVCWQKRTTASVLRELRQIQEEMERFQRRENLCMGTTCTLALVKKSRFLLFHLGDSRAYRIGKKERCLTKDHQQDGVLRRCMGAFGYQEPDVRPGRLRRDELLLLCTDGFCRMIPEGFLKGCFYEGRQGRETFYKRLKGVAGFLKAQGEKDNQTAVLLANRRKNDHG